MGFFSALVFLSRLGRPDNSKLAYAPGLLWYGVVGAFLGLLCLFGALLPLFLPGMRSLPLTYAAALCALFWLSLEIWLSRAMHWDGLADLGDALGSGAEGGKFVRVLTDSRLGAFGALLIIIIFLWQLLFLASLIYQALFLPNGLPLLLLSPLACAWSRLSPIWLARLGKPRSDSFLGKMLCGALSPRIFRLALPQAPLCLFLAWLCGMTISAIAVLVLGEASLLAYLARAAKKNGGLSGDFFGACIELSQTAFLACACLATP